MVSIGWYLGFFKRPLGDAGIVLAPFTGGPRFRRKSAPPGAEPGQCSKAGREAAFGTGDSLALPFWV